MVAHILVDEPSTGHKIEIILSNNPKSEIQYPKSSSLSFESWFSFLYERQLPFFQILTEEGSFGNGLCFGDAAFTKYIGL